jgi:hypothetical protein
MDFNTKLREILNGGNFNGKSSGFRSVELNFKFGKTLNPRTLMGITLIL